MTDPQIVRHIDQMCEKTGDIEVKNIMSDGRYTLVIPVFNGELGINQTATLDMEFTFDGEEATLLNFPKNLLSAEDYCFVTESIEDEMAQVMAFINLGKKYGFKVEERLVNSSSSKLANDLKPCLYLCAKNTDNAWAPWISYFPHSNGLAYHGNTDHLNIWLSVTRKDFTPEKCLEFVDDLNKKFSLSGADKFSVKELIDPEDWQVLADVRDAYEDERYTGQKVVNLDSRIQNAASRAETNSNINEQDKER